MSNHHQLGHQLTKADAEANLVSLDHFLRDAEAMGLDEYLTSAVATLIEVFGTTTVSHHFTEDEVFLYGAEQVFWSVTP